MFEVSFSMSVIRLKVNSKEKNDISVSLRVTKAANGFILKTGDAPIVFSTIHELSDALSEALKKVDWEEK